MKFDIESLDAIIFDLGGVILNLDYNETINAFKKLGGANFEELYTQAYQSKMIDKFEVGEVSAQEFVDYLKGFLPPEISDQRIIDAWNVMLLDLPPHRVEFLKRLRKKIPIFLFSNTNAIHIEFVRSYLKEQFQDEDLLSKLFVKAYLSHTSNRRKPNKDAFELVITEHRLNPAKTLFIDDSVQHIEGARATGLQAYHLVDEDIVDIFNFE